MITTLLLGAVAIVAIISGIAKMKGGLSEIFGSGDEAAVKALLTESDAAAEAGNKHLNEAAPKFQAILTAVDETGLEQVRTDHRDDADQANKNFEEAAKQFRLGADKLDEVMKLSVVEKFKSYLTLKTKSYRMIADSYDKNREILRLIMDEPITTAEDITARVLKVVEARDADQKGAQEASAEADKVWKPE